jgi:TolB-like protein/class 3 adenylate cyclase
MHTPGRRLTAIVFTDIVGYSAIVHHDEALGARLLDRQREVVRRIVPQHGGKEVETAGDSFLLEFGSALAAVQAVIAIQQELARQNESEAEKVVLRASVHLGDIEHRGKEVYGDGVNTAARLLPHSPEGGLALSAPVLSMVRQRMQLPAKSIGMPPLKNIENPVEIFVLDATALPALAASGAVPAPSRVVPGSYRRRFLVALAGVVVLAAVFAGGRYFQSGKAETAAPGKSVAVLPFADLSPAHDHEYFSDGMAEELLNALAKVKDLKVAGRTSSFSFKGRSDDLRSIGRMLGVANVLEGSVRKQGDKVRITAQLVRTEDGFHLWSESYDGDLSDIFDLQERIARAITQSLQVVLNEGQQRLVPVATDHPDAYALYLKASKVFSHRDGPHFPDAIADLQQALRLDPKFARAHARLAAMHAVAPIYTPMSLDEALVVTEREARAAIALDPALAEPHAALGEIYNALRRPLAARIELSTAIALDPGDAIANVWLGEILHLARYTREAIAYFDKALAVDSLQPLALFFRGSAHLHEGDLTRARPMLQKSVDAGLPFAELSMAFIAHAQGRTGDAILHMTRGQRQFLLGLPDDASRVLAEGIYGSAAARAKAVKMLEGYLAGKPATIAAGVPYGLLLLGEPARALAVAAEAPTTNDAELFFWLWAPEGSAARKLSQFVSFARKVGWTEVWDQYDPPPACQRTSPGNYVCK